MKDNVCLYELSQRYLMEGYFYLFSLAKISVSLWKTATFQSNIVTCC